MGFLLCFFWEFSKNIFKDFSRIPSEIPSQVPAVIRLRIPTKFLLDPSRNIVTTPQKNSVWVSPKIRHGISLRVSPEPPLEIPPGVSALPLEIALHVLQGFLHEML